MNRPESDSGLEPYAASLEELREFRPAAAMAVEMALRRTSITTHVDVLLREGLKQFGPDRPDSTDLDGETARNYFSLPVPDMGWEVVVEVNAPTESWPNPVPDDVATIRINVQPSHEDIDEDEFVVPGVTEWDLFHSGGVTFEHDRDTNLWTPVRVTDQEALDFLECIRR